MNLLTLNKVISFIGTVEKGIYPAADGSRELYKITNSKGVFYAVTEDFELHTVSEIPEGVSKSKWCYTEADGFYENPNYNEFNRYSRDYRTGYEQALLDLVEVE